MFDILGQRPMTLRRPTGPETVTNHRAVAPAYAETTIWASDQPATGADLVDHLGGQRVKKAKWFLCASELRGVNEATKVPADRIVVDGEVYELVEVSNWGPGQDVTLAYWRGLGVRVEQS